MFLLNSGCAIIFTMYSFALTTMGHCIYLVQPQVQFCYTASRRKCVSTILFFYIQRFTMYFLEWSFTDSIHIKY